MADLNTPAKRFSGMNIGCPWRGISYLPTGAVDAAERLAFVFLYSGIAADAVQLVVIRSDCVVRMRGRSRRACK